MASRLYAILHARPRRTSMFEVGLVEHNFPTHNCTTTCAARYGLQRHEANVPLSMDDKLTILNMVYQQLQFCELTTTILPFTSNSVRVLDDDILVYPWRWTHGCVGS